MASRLIVVKPLVLSKVGLDAIWTNSVSHGLKLVVATAIQSLACQPRFEPPPVTSPATLI